MRTIVWLIRAAIFFTLFAFALNNNAPAKLVWFFGYEWHAPMVFIVLAAFALGCAFGVFAMVPSWWRHRRIARTQVVVPVAAEVTPPPAAPLVPPRDGL